MDEALSRKCDAHLKSLLKRSQAIHFAKPVDWKKMGLHDYPRLIKQPMDLGTVQENITKGKYARLEDFATDVRLVWVRRQHAPPAPPTRARHTPPGGPPPLSPLTASRDLLTAPRLLPTSSQKNAYIFNAPDSMYFKAAKTLSDAFEKKLEEMERESEQINMPALDAMERCGILLGDMAKNPYAEWFCEPVDHVNLGLHDYLQVIKEPQDLGTISKKYERQQYMSPEDLARDVRLVWQNAITYNSASSMFGVVASILAQVFDRRFALITRSSFGDPGRPIPDRPGYPTFTQKKKFYDLCTKLTLADLNQMVSLVQRGCGSAVQQCGDKEVEVDVDELDNETFNKVMSWAQQKTKANE